MSSHITNKQDKSKESYTVYPNGEILKSVKKYNLSWNDHIHC